MKVNTPACCVDFVLHSDHFFSPFELSSYQFPWLAPFCIAHYVFLSSFLYQPFPVSSSLPFLLSSLISHPHFTTSFPFAIHAILPHSIISLLNTTYFSLLHPISPSFPFIHSFSHPLSFIFSASPPCLPF